MRLMSLEKKLFLGVFLAKFLILGVFLFVFGTQNIAWSDSETYIRIGKNIYAGRGFSDAHMSKTEFPSNAIRMPLYPLVIGFFDTHMPYGLLGVSFLQALLAAGIAVLTYKIGTRFLSSKMAWIAAIVASFEPLISVMNILIMPETFLIFFLLLFFLLFLKYMESGEIRHLFVSIVALVLAIYTKPVALYLVAVPILFLCFSGKRGVVRGATMLALVFLLLLPWMARNQSALGIFDVTADDSGNLCGWELVSVLATKYHIDSSDFTTLYALPEYAVAKNKCVGTVSAIKMYVRDYPVDFFKTNFLSAASFLTNDGYGAFFGLDNNHLTPAVFINHDWINKIRSSAGAFIWWQLAVISIGKLFWLFVSVAACVGMFFGLRGAHRRRALLLFLVILYFIAVTVVSTGYGVGARLRYPIGALLIISALMVLRQKRAVDNF